MMERGQSDHLTIVAPARKKIMKNEAIKGIRTIQNEMIQVRAAKDAPKGVIAAVNPK